MAIDSTPPTSARDRRYWEQHARRYDRSLRLLNKSLPRLLELVSEAVRGKHHVLEVAAGTGLLTMAIASTAKQVTATDYADAMVHMLRERVRSSAVDNVRCEQADLYALPYPAGTFDAVVAANVLHLVPDFSRAIAALRAVLRPDGTLIVPTFAHDETLLSAAVSRVLAVTGFPGHRRFTADSLRRAVESEGVVVERIETLAGLIPITYVEGSFRT
jgi:ubiquinone/menaquinone biosynthesis C-methylase UbiE